MSDKDPTYTPSSGRRANRQAHSRKSKPYDSPPDRSEGENSDDGHENPKSRPRLRHSCLLCRVRCKSCPNQYDPSSGEPAPERPCTECARLGLECLGWGNQRPRFLQDRAKLKAIKRALKRHNESNIHSSPPKALLSLAPFYESTDFTPPFPIATHSHLYDTPPAPSASPLIGSGALFAGLAPEGLPQHTTIEDSVNNLTLTGLPWPAWPFGSLVNNLDGLISFSGEDLAAYPSGVLEQPLVASCLPAPSVPVASDHPFNNAHSNPYLSQHDLQLIHSLSEQPSLSASHSLASIAQPQQQQGSIPSFTSSITEQLWPAFIKWLNSVHKRLTPYESTLDAVNLSAFVGEDAPNYQQTILALQNLTAAIETYPSISPSILKAQSLNTQSLSARACDDANDPSIVIDALCGVQFAVVAGDKSNWVDRLEIACQRVPAIWNAVVKGSAASSAARILVGMTVWYDIIAALTLRRAPLLAQLLPEILRADSPVQLHEIMGCENSVMYALGEIARVASLLRTDGNGPELVPPEQLVRKVASIRAALSESTQLPSSAIPSPAYSGVSDLSPPPLVHSSFIDPCSPASFSQPSDDTFPSPVSEHLPNPLENQLLAVSTVTRSFAATGQMVLNQILLRYSTRVSPVPFSPTECEAKLADSTEHVMSRIRYVVNAKGCSAARAILWPLCVAGCAVRCKGDKEWFAEMFRNIKSLGGYGSIVEADSLVHRVWSEEQSLSAAIATTGFPLSEADEPIWTDLLGATPPLLV